MSARRASENPIITPASIRPSRPDMRVVGAFNPAVTRIGDETLLLLRVAEGPIDVPPDEVAAPVFDAGTGDITVRRWKRTAPGVEGGDPRLIGVGHRTWLTSISHLRVARSSDGIHFDVEDAPALAASTELEAFGVEDPRITRIDDTYWINYTAVSPWGIATALASTRDFRRFERHGIILPPPNRDVTIFPERIGGRFMALHRPMPTHVGEPAIWIADSGDLRSWGGHRLVAAPRGGDDEAMWDDEKIGGGAVPFRVRVRGRDGWLAIYHGVRRATHEYALGALLLDGGDPSRVLGRSCRPILRPEAPYEREGFFGGVVFTCGVLPEAETVRIYYGAADGVTAVADLALAEILVGLA